MGVVLSVELSGQHPRLLVVFELKVKWGWVSYGTVDSAPLRLCQNGPPPPEAI